MNYWETISETGFCKGKSRKEKPDVVLIKTIESEKSFDKDSALYKIKDGHKKENNKCKKLRHNLCWLLLRRSERERLLTKWQLFRNFTIQRASRDFEIAYLLRWYEMRQQWRCQKEGYPGHGWWALRSWLVSQCRIRESNYTKIGFSVSLLVDSELENHSTTLQN